MAPDDGPHHDGMRYFDLYHGSELNSQPEPAVMARWPLPDCPPFVLLHLEAHGYGAILATHGEPSDAQRELMAKMKSMTAKPLASLSPMSGNRLPNR